MKASPFSNPFLKWVFFSITVLAIPAFVALGFWQLSRYHEKQHILADFYERQENPPLNLVQAEKHPFTLNYSPLKTTGEFENNTQILLDNRYHEHQIGYEVLSLFKPQNGDKYLLVNRGWIPASKGRSALPPTIEPIQGAHSLFGTLYSPEKKTFTLNNEPEILSNGMIRIQAIDYAQLEKMLNKPLYPFQMRLSADQPYGFVRDWKPVYSPPARHLGYAVQWFALACAIVLFFLYTLFKLGDDERYVEP